MSDSAPREAAVRLFCLVLPGGRHQLGWDYLQAFDEADCGGVLACPIGMAYLSSEPWASVYRLFQGQTTKRFVNVVVAPPNYLMGTRIRAADVAAPPRLPRPGEETAPFAMSTPRRAVRHSDGVPAHVDLEKSDVVYEPSTALSGLYTVGVPNVAVTLPRPTPPSFNEIRALSQYDRVIAPTEGDAQILCELGVAAIHMPPEPALLRWLVQSLLPVIVPV